MDLTSIPRWALILLATTGVLAVGAIGTMAGAEIRTATSTNTEQEIEIAILKLEVAELKEARRETNVKLDKILERLGASP